MIKKPFVTKEKVEEIVKTYPTPFHIYDERGIRENAEKLKQAFAATGYREDVRYFQDYGSRMYFMKEM